jgi:hypothetical protein
MADSITPSLLYVLSGWEEATGKGGQRGRVEVAEEEMKVKVKVKEERGEYGGYFPLCSSLRSRALR